MSALSATGRLLWRPAIILALFGLAGVTGLAFWDFNFDSAAPGSGPQAPAEDAAYVTLWRFATIVPAMAGALLSLLMRELQHTLFAWSLPGLSRRLLLGKTIAGALFATGMGLVAARFWGAPVAVAIFGWSWLTFATGGVALDPVLPKIESRGAALLMVALWFRPLYVERLMAIQPYLGGSLAVAVGTLLLVREFGATLSRRRPLTFFSADGANTPEKSRQYWASHGAADRDWTRSLSRGEIAAWVLAGIHESYGGRRGAYGALLAWQMAMLVVYCYLVGNLAMAAIFPWIFIGTSAVHLSRRFLYPLDRRERAKLFFASTLVEILTVSLVSTSALAIMSAIGTRPGVGTDGQTVAETLELLAFFVALAPIGQWAKVRGSIVDLGTSSAYTAARYFAYQAVFMAVALSISMAARNYAPDASLWIAAAVSLAAYGTFWFALQRYFATKDLVVARA